MICFHICPARAAHGNRSSGVQHLIWPFLSREKRIYIGIDCSPFIIMAKLVVLRNTASECIFSSILGARCIYGLDMLASNEKPFAGAPIKCSISTRELSAVCQDLLSMCSTVCNVLERVQNVASMQVIFRCSRWISWKEMHLTLFTGVYPFYCESYIARVKSCAASRQSQTSFSRKTWTESIDSAWTDACRERLSWQNTKEAALEQNISVTTQITWNWIRLRIVTDQRSPFTILLRFERFLSQHSWHLHHKRAIRTILLARLTGLVGVFHRLGHRSLFVCKFPLIL